MTITVNGQLKDLKNISNIEELVFSLVEKNRNVLVELNQRIVKRNDWKSRLIREGDTVDLVQLVGGG
ncbi:MAG: sulfur carrier protein ThiS [Candidatus Omnitrophota bacterium]